MNNYIIVVAGGRGSRMKTSVPKQFIELRGKAILHYTLQKFRDVLPSFSLVVVLPENDIPHWNNYCIKNKMPIRHKIVSGGKERFYSVKNALDAIDEGILVGIHDGVRPFVSSETILNTRAIAVKKGNAIPIIPIKDSIRELNSKGTNLAKNRENLVAVQTPQFFNFDLITDAYKQNFHPKFTDDASVVENLGIPINLARGNPENIKLTTPFDLSIAKAILGS